MLKRTKILHKFKKCNVCKKKRVLFSHGKCERCAKVNYDFIPKSIIPKGIKTRKPTGELALFKKLWEGYAHQCFVCAKPIPNFSHNNFAHILSKGAYPSLRLKEENIILMCHNTQGTGCHNLYDTKARSVFEKLPSGDLVCIMADMLKAKYYKESKVEKIKDKFNYHYGDAGQIVWED